MLDFAFRFRDTLSLALFVCALAGGVVVFALIWPTVLRTRRAFAVAVGVIAAQVALLCSWAATIRIDSDEAVHLHATWLVSRGLVPFRDFFQDHSPALWYLLSPVISWFQSPTVFVFSRALAVVLFLACCILTGWLAWRIHADRRAAVLAALILLALGIRTEGGFLRPDQLTNALVLLSLGIVSYSRPSRVRAFLAGLVFALGLSFTPKPVFASAAFPLVLLLCGNWPATAGNERYGWREKLRAILFYALGGIAGLAPLFLVICRQNIVEQYIFWVFLNHSPGGRIESYFPAGVLLAALAGIVWIFRDHSGKEESAVSPLHAVWARLRSAGYGPMLMAIAFLLQTLANTLGLGVSGSPSTLMLWGALGAVLASRPVVSWLYSIGPLSAGDAAAGNRSFSQAANPAACSSRGSVGAAASSRGSVGAAASSLPGARTSGPTRGLLLAGFLLTLIAIDGLSPLVNRRTLGDFTTDRARIGWMLKQSAGRPVVLVTPVHSVFATDATGLYELWQYSHHIGQPAIAGTIQGFSERLIANRPALIAVAPRRITDDPAPRSEDRPSLFQQLESANIITSLERRSLEQFVAAHYDLAEFAGEQFYVWVR